MSKSAEDTKWIGDNVKSSYKKVKDGFLFTFGSLSGKSVEVLFSKTEKTPENAKRCLFKEK